MADIDPTRAVVLCMDYQNDIVTKFVPVPPEMFTRAAAVLERARAASIPVIYVVVQFREGHPELADRGMFKRIRDTNGFVEGTEGAAIHPTVAPKHGDVVVTKRRVSAFAGSDLDCLLRASGRTHLILLGVATGGVVLSTIRAAGDLDYEMNVISDCCADADAEVHRVLIEKVFPRMAPAMTADEFVSALSK